jgi:hypothetical protein
LIAARAERGLPLDLRSVANLSRFCFDLWLAEIGL